MLIGLALGSLIALLWPILTRSAAGSLFVSVTEAVRLINQSKPYLLDVRNESEFAEGHIAGAHNIPVAQLTEGVHTLEKYKDKPVLVICQRGGRAKTAATILKSQQFSAVQVLEGGVHAWQKANMPLSKTK